MPLNGVWGAKLKEKTASCLKQKTVYVFGKQKPST